MINFSQLSLNKRLTYNTFLSNSRYTEMFWDFIILSFTPMCDSLRMWLYYKTRQRAIGISSTTQVSIKKKLHWNWVISNLWKNSTLSSIIFHFHLHCSFTNWQGSSRRVFYVSYPSNERRDTGTRYTPNTNRSSTHLRRQMFINTQYRWESSIWSLE